MTEISKKPVFGTYDQEENQVTAALLKILEVADYSLLHYLLQDVGGYNLPRYPVSIETQLRKKGRASVPDARLSCHCSFDIYIESKLRTDIGTKQLTNHLEWLRNEKQPRGTDKKLLYITTHDYRPDCLPQDVLWTSWENVLNGLRDYQGKQKQANPILDYLIGQFELLLTELHLYDAGKDTRVIVVGGHWAEPVAKEYHFYACQGNRYFRPAKYLAFACNKRIKYIYEILEKKTVDDMSECPEVTDEFFEKNEPGYKDHPEKRTLFSLKLHHEFKEGEEIKDDSISKNGRPCAFTQNQTYTDIDTIMSAKFTSDIKKKRYAK